MIRLDEHHREIANVLALYGIRPDIEPTNGGHVRFKWKVGASEQALLTSKTPSDWRTRRNAVARVRRMLKSAGLTKIDPCASVIEAAPATPPIEPPTPAPSPAPMTQTQLEARVAQLERDMEALLELVTTKPVVTTPVEKPVASATAPKSSDRPKKKMGRRPNGWIWPAMRYDVFMHVNDIADAANRRIGLVSAMLTYWKGKGYIEHKPGKGWRKRPNVEQLDCAPNPKPKPNGRTNGRANGHRHNGVAAH